MNLINTLIVGFCLNMPTVYNDACVNATDAASRQTGFRQGYERIEYGLGKYANDFMINKTGKEGAFLLSGGVYTYEMYRTKRISFKTKKTLGICDYMNYELNNKNGLLKFNWGF